MANPNRASMREGPLAALFRKTEEPAAEPAERANLPAPSWTSSRPYRPRSSRPS